MDKNVTSNTFIIFFTAELRAQAIRNTGGTKPGCRCGQPANGNKGEKSF